ncbi:FadR/GntR family transcriptional regulator [Sphingomonas crusticola]|uniref:FadR/GntR family transcriptional regulator n=1 Tax=Sphingomonas crusticola TaxID=1697973 RepID=UPI000E263D6D|nr:FadR/GntR family transcriptional regulator [Sphingomonas crusticola]
MLEDLGRAIVTGHYEGERFPTEDELTARYAVSRTVTREAVKMLTAKGLLKARPRAGTTVQPPSAWSVFDPDVLRWLLERKFSLDLLRHFNELRSAIEPQAAALAAVAGPSPAYDAIEAGLQRMEAAERGEDDTLEADIAFHIAVLEASANPFFLQFRDMVATALRTSIRFTNRFKGRAADVPAHRAVFTAIQASDPVAARAAMTAIIGEVMDFITTAGTKP